MHVTPKGEPSYLLPNKLGGVSMLVETPRTDNIQAEASVQNLKIAHSLHRPYSLAVERLFARFNLPPNSKLAVAEGSASSSEAPEGHIMYNANMWHGHA